MEIVLVNLHLGVFVNFEIRNSSVNCGSWVLGSHIYVSKPLVDSKSFFNSGMHWVDRIGDRRNVCISLYLGC